MKRKLLGRHGSITVFLCVILSAMILLESIYIAGAYKRKREVVLAQAVSHQVEQILSQFDRNLLTWYGVYAISDVKQGSAVFDRMTKSIENTSFSYALTGEFDNNTLRSSILDFMRLRGIAFEGNAILEQLGVSISDIRSKNISGKGLSSWMPTFQTLLDNKRYVSGILDKLRGMIKDSGFGDKVDTFNEFLDDARMAWEEKSSSVIELGDSSASVSMFDPTSISSLTSMFDTYMDADLPGFVDRMIMNEYAAFQFDSRIDTYITTDGFKPEKNMTGVAFTDIHGENKSDLEYLLIGSDHEWVNHAAVDGILFGTRLILDFGSFMMDEAKKQTALIIAEVMALIIALISAGTVIIDPFSIQYAILFIMAYIRAITDTAKLINGQSVPIFYNDKVISTLGGFAYADYRDYFRVLLLFVPESWLLSRMRTVIERDAGKTLYTGVKGIGTLDGTPYVIERRCDLYADN